MANPYLVQPASYGSGLAGLGQSLVQAGQVSRQRQEQEDIKLKQERAIAEREQAIGEIETAITNKDYDSLNAIGMRYPTLYKNAVTMLNVADEREMDNAVDVGFKIIQNPEQFDQLIDDNPKFAATFGGVDVARQQYAEDPDGTIDQAKQFLSMFGGDKWKQFREYEKGLTAGDMTDYQSATIEAKKTDQWLRQQEIDLKKLESKAKKAKTEQEKEKADLDIQKKKQDIQNTQEEITSSANDAVASASEGLALINEIENHQGFSSYIGAKGASSLFGLKDEPMAGTDAAGVASLIETLSSQQFMSSIQNMQGMGALSDAEGKKLSAAISSLNPDMSEKDFKRSLDTIRRFFSRGMSKAKAKGGKEAREAKPQTKADTFTSKGGVTFKVK